MSVASKTTVAQRNVKDTVNILRSDTYHKRMSKLIKEWPTRVRFIFVGAAVAYKSR